MRTFAAVVVATLLLSACGEPAGLSPPPPTTTAARPCPSGGGTAVIDWVPFVRVDGRTYEMVDMSRDEARVTQDLVGQRVSEVACKLADVVTDPDYRPQDGDAAHLEPGTALHRLVGFDRGFRLVARTPEGDFVYEAQPLEDMERARQLYGDIEGRVNGVSVNSEQDGETPIGRIDDRVTVARLVQLLLDAPFAHEARRDDDGPRYFLEFELEQGPPLNLVLFAGGPLLGRGIRVPQEFVEAVRAAVD